MSQHSNAHLIDLSCVNAVDTVVSKQDVDIE